MPVTLIFLKNLKITLDFFFYGAYIFNKRYCLKPARNIRTIIKPYSEPCLHQS